MSIEVARGWAGDGFRLRRIAAHVADEPIMPGEIDKYLPQLPEQRVSLIELRSLDRIDNRITHRLNKAGFIRRD